MDALFHLRIVYNTGIEFTRNLHCRSLCEKGVSDWIGPSDRWTTPADAAACAGGGGGSNRAFMLMLLIAYYTYVLSGTQKPSSDGKEIPAARFPTYLPRRGSPFRDHGAPHKGTRTFYLTAVWFLFFVEMQIETWSRNNVPTYLVGT